MSIETKNESSADLPQEFIEVAKYFYGSAAECVRKFRALRDEENPHRIYDAAQRYADAYGDFANACALTFDQSAAIRAKGNKEQIASLNRALEDFWRVTRIVNLNNSMIKTKYESYVKRRVGGGMIAKTFGLLSDLKDVGIDFAGKGWKMLGRGKRMVDRGVVSVVRAIVPKPVRKAVGWVGQMGQDVQDFWSEVF
ncbi:hypothetical protein HY604_02875 [Candidatus Peregrinibacteria bacterium]|nr:hypothetical protein [Candidatus Peregrinibacteria bacterium]